MSVDGSKRSKKIEPKTIIIIMPNELHEHLRALRQEMGNAKRERQELKHLIIAGQQDVNALRGDILRVERSLEAVQVDMDRIKTTLNR